MLRKTILTALGLAASSFALAGMPGSKACLQGNVTVPCETKKWDIGVQALYLKSAFDADYVYGLAQNGFYRDADNDWDWAFRLEGSYHFSTGNDITMTWIHYDTGDHHGGFNGLIPLNESFIALNIPYVLRIDNQFDQVNLVMGQHTDVGLFKNIRFYGGLQYADIRVDASNNFLITPTLLVAAGVRAVRQYHNTDFNGVGPVIGIDYAYNLTDGFSVTANSAMSILYGTGRFSDGYLFSNDLIPVANYGSKKMVVPSLEAKLGVNYAFSMAEGVLNLEAGYQAVNYFNALQTRGLNATGTPTNSDYGLYGPYLGAKWVGYA
ncbi:Lpg1974 family pore-forming outer membrane protein [Legionella israelensis]|uniref:Outer membrane protein n=1 Tax=Legionella israelensis TaxID=454 RepID=A0A0W0V2C0_9GAMM|nr:Lpg1974 family pore-forming outer membrane protein [Legionella israelensis]KTD14006.1 outer membrane protein [Legionella israelensis]QBS09665.1 hypothetical protein E4T55_07195 [Legionella israelensis]SCY26001.1 Legionella pneumophila major outer membrane protein precursor [Legionella israelensis DSM 19235]STX60596.1 major outer membrane protein [Legionella israelensis]